MGVNCGTPGLAVVGWDINAANIQVVLNPGPQLWLYRAGVSLRLSLNLQHQLGHGIVLFPTAQSLTFKLMIVLL